MSTNLSRRVRGFRVTLALSAALAVILLMTQAPAVMALPEPHMRALKSGMVGLAEGQTARLNVVNVLTTPPPEGDRVCAVELSFLDADGSVITGRDGSQARLTVRLARGQSAFLDLPATFVPAVQRTQIRASARANRTCLGSIDDPNIMPSIEVFDDATGRTTAFVDGSSWRFIKEVDPAPAP